MGTYSRMSLHEEIVNVVTRDAIKTSLLMKKRRKCGKERHSDPMSEPNTGRLAATRRMNEFITQSSLREA